MGRRRPHRFRAGANPIERFNRLARIVHKSLFLTSERNVRGRKNSPKVSRDKFRGFRHGFSGKDGATGRVLARPRQSLSALEEAILRSTGQLSPAGPRSFKLGYARGRAAGEPG
jgi:hypothetical protein